MVATFPARTDIRSFAVVFLNVSVSFVKRKMHFFSFLSLDKSYLTQDCLTDISLNPLISESAANGFEGSVSRNVCRRKMRRLTLNHRCNRIFERKFTVSLRLAFYQLCKIT